MLHQFALAARHGSRCATPASTGREVRTRRQRLLTRIGQCLIAVVFGGVVHAASTAPPALVDDELSRTLVVSFDPVVVPNAVSIVESHVGAASGEFYELLQRPMAAKRLLYRPPTAVELRIAEIDPYAPEAMISKYVRVTYPRGTDLSVIRSRLAGTSQIRSVETVGASGYSSQPDDQYFIASGPFAERQYGMQTYDAVSNRGGLSFSTAWDLIWGSAYVGVLDAGIQTSDATNSTGQSVGLHGELAANFRQQLSHNMMCCQRSTWGGLGIHTAMID